MKSVLAGLVLALLLSVPARATCREPPQDPITHIHVPGQPFSAIVSRDGCTIFVSTFESHILVIARDGGAILHDTRVGGGTAEMSLSPDGRFLAAATHEDGVAIFDAAKLAAGADNFLVASANDGPHAGSVYTAFTPDGRLLFVADEDSASLSVYDTSGLPQKLIPLGKIPVGAAPVGLTVSADGQYLYSTSQVGPADLPTRCTSEGPRHPEGTLAVIDVAKAQSDPAHAVLGKVAAGCNPVRVARSPSGATLYVTARGDNTVLTFDASKLLSDPAHAMIAKTTVGEAPVGVIAVGDKVIVTNSNRFGGGDHQTLSVLKAADLAAAPASLPAGGFPRELALSPDGGLLLVTNFASRDLEIIDLERLDQAEK